MPCLRLTFGGHSHYSALGNLLHQPNIIFLEQLNLGAKLPQLTLAPGNLKLVHGLKLCGEQSNLLL